VPPDFALVIECKVKQNSQFYQTKFSKVLRKILKSSTFSSIFPHYRLSFLLFLTFALIATHGIIKKTQKTPKKEIAKAERIRQEYFKAKKG
jgi:phage-related protein